MSVFSIDGTAQIPRGEMKRRPKPQCVAFFFEAKDHADAQRKVDDGCIEASCLEGWPSGTKITYDRRTIRFNRELGLPK